MTLQEKWITSGASRLKAIQNRGFSYRAKQRATAGSVGTVMDNKRGDGRRQPAKRRRIIVGQTASSAAIIDPYASSGATMTGVQCMDRNLEHHSAVQEQPDFQRGNRRIREGSSTIHPRDHLSESHFGAGTFRGPFAMQTSPLDPLARITMAADGLSSNGRPSSLAESIALQRGISTLSDPLGGPLHQFVDRQTVHAAGINNLLLPTQGIGMFRPILFSATNPAPSSSSSALSSRISKGMLSSEFFVGELGPNSFLGPPQSPQELIRHLLASRHPAQSQSAAPDEKIQRLYSLADEVTASQQQCARWNAADNFLGKVDMLGSPGIAKLQNQQPRSSPSESDADSISTKESKKVKLQKKPIRFFNAGIEVSVDGRSVVSIKSVPCTDKLKNAKKKSPEGVERSVKQH